MSDFSAEWLALREPADHRARSEAVAAKFRAALEAKPRFRLVDLATGTGSNVRFLAPRLGQAQDWLLIDKDPALLDECARCLPQQGEGQAWNFELRCIDLVTRLVEFDLSESHAVSASALLDLVSEEWLAWLVQQCRQARAAALFALSYDGRMEIEPVAPDDEWVRELVNLHQRRDKGFGPALGPQATETALHLFTAAGYETYCEPSDWVLEADARPLQSALIAGWAQAALEMQPDAADRIELWRQRRLDHVAAGRSRLIVGHQDFAAWLPRQ